MCEQLDLAFGGLTLRDNLLWGTESVYRGEPEAFARQTVAELQLPAAFVQPIAFAIRDQVFRYQLRFVEPESSSSSNGDKAPQDQQEKETLQKPVTREYQEKLQWGPLLEPAATAKLIPGSTLVNCSRTPFLDLGTVTQGSQARASAAK